ncbi:insulinase family protein [Martelella alba]|uniref:Insulinase family protein n=1 Tax=Martelella alba TaxID=2590451 RepID=A0A506UCR6_9HYPH|nr:insulinase family protein [Martelella alba]TPW32232.1 insulinase family protein [Martelella alba]
MIRIAILAGILLICSGCSSKAPIVREETSATGIDYAFIPMTDIADRRKAKDDARVAIRVIWASDWAARSDRNQMLPGFAAGLLPYAGWPVLKPADTIEQMADYRASYALHAWPGGVTLGLSVPRQYLNAAVEHLNTLLTHPALESKWFDRYQDERRRDITETGLKTWSRLWAAASYMIFDDTPLRIAVARDRADLAGAITQDDVRVWSNQTFQRAGAKVAIAGPLSASEADAAIDQLFAGLAEGEIVEVPPFALAVKPEKLLLVDPDAGKSVMAFFGQMDEAGREAQFEHYFDNRILHQILNTGMLTDVARGGERASYGFSGRILRYATFVPRELVLSGEVETAKIAAIDDAIRDGYGQFLKGDMSSAGDRRKAIKGDMDLKRRDVDVVADNAVTLMSVGFGPQSVIQWLNQIDLVDEDSLRDTLSTYPPMAALSTIVVSKDRNALPGACVIAAPEEAVGCP